MNRKNKNAMEMQFNWIFILIAGAVILSFFMGLFSWYKATKNSEMAVESLQTIKATLASAQASSDTAKIIDIPEVPLQFFCYPDTCNDYGCDSFIEFKGTGANAKTEVDVIFSPDEMKSNRLITWTIPWEQPYKVTDFLYLSNPLVRYILVYSDDEPLSRSLAMETDKMLSDNKYVSRQMVEAANIADVHDENDYLVKFVLFYNPGAGLNVDNSLIKQKNWDVVLVSGDSIKGTVKFLYEKGSRKPGAIAYPYIGMPMLMGGIFAEKPASYACNAKKAFIRLELINQLYIERTKLLLAAYAADPDCMFYYDINTMNSFNAIKESVSGKKLTEIGTIESVDAMRKLERVNSEVLYKDCPRIY
jgi:hypothetical protein